jgi:hypothetical protein
MSKYIPKVGEVFEYKTSGGWKKQPEVVFETEKQIAFIGLQGFIILLSKENNFRPIQKKSDDELYNLVLIIEDCYESGISVTAKEIQQAGFTIPPSIKRSEISMIISRNSNYCKNPMFPSMLSGICELLGDLVEQDDGGDV